VGAQFAREALDLLRAVRWSGAPQPDTAGLPAWLLPQNGPEQVLAAG